MLFHVPDEGADSLDCALQLFAADAEFLGPVVEVVFLVMSICIAALGKVVRRVSRHGIPFRDGGMSSRIAKLVPSVLKANPGDT